MIIIIIMSTIGVIHHIQQKELDNQSSTDISLSKAVSTTMNLRKKG